MRIPKVAIIIPNYNGASILYKGKPVIKNCLDALKNTSYKNYTIVIPDDCSTDNSLEYLKKNYPYVSIIKNNVNGGYAKNTNSGIRFAIKKFDPDYVVQYNDDVIIKDKRWLDKLVEIAEKESDVGLVGCKLIYPNGRIQSTEYNVRSVPRYIGRSEPDNGQYDYIRETSGVNAALVLMRRKLIDKIGILDENYYMGFDDADYMIRAKQAGYKIIYDGKLEVTHLESMTNVDSISDRRFYLCQVGYVYFAFKHLNAPQKVNAVLHELAGAVFTIDAQNDTRGLAHLRFRNKPVWRLGVSIKAIFKGYSTYVNSKKPSHTRRS